MKKILQIGFLFIIAGCALDTFEPDNLATWTINLDFPIFKTVYTYHDLLNDYDDIDIEQFENSSDSIFVFNVSTPHRVQVQNYTITRDGDSTVPEPVQIENYEISVPELPSELEVIKIVDADLTLEFDLSRFDVSLADSVIVDSIEIIAVNANYEIARGYIRNQDILDGEPLSVVNAEDIINIRPTRASAVGMITIYPSDQPGTQVFGQSIGITSHVRIPLILELTNSSTYSTKPEVVNIDVDDDIFKTATVFTNIDNQMELSGRLHFLVATDTTYFNPDASIAADTLFTVQLLEQQTQTDTILFDQAKIGLFENSTNMKILLNLQSSTDSNGSIIPTHFFTNDSLKILLYGSTEALVDPQNIDGND